MAAFPQTMPQSGYNQGLSPPPAMNAPYTMYQPAMIPPGGNMASNMVPAAGQMPPRAGGRGPQGYYGSPAASPVNAPAPMKGTLRPGESIRVGNHTVVVEKYLSEGQFIFRMASPARNLTQSLSPQVDTPMYTSHAPMSLSGRTNSRSTASSDWPFEKSKHQI